MDLRILHFETHITLRKLDTDYTKHKKWFETQKTQVGAETGRLGAETGARAPRTRFFNRKRALGRRMNSNFCAQAPNCALERRLSILNSDFFVS